jgi:predicted RecB family nuclease
MSETTYSISKTSFIKFEQCAKAFYLYKKHPYLRDKPSIDKQLTFKRGHDVGFYAQQLFPGGTDISAATKNYNEALELTRTLIAEGTPVIYEATFIYNSVLVMVDILCREETGKYSAYEIKSSLKVSETYLKDAYLQYYVVKNVLPALDDFFLVTLNPDYRLEKAGEADPRKLFRRRSLGQKAAENFDYFGHRINQALEILDRSAIPNIPIGKHCFRPYQCDFFGSCWKNLLSENSIFSLPLIDKNTVFEWHEKGLKSLSEITTELDEKKDLINIKNAILSGQPVVNLPAIQQFLQGIEAPVAAMDMEIWNPAIPELQGTAPFEQIPFLVSIYNGSVFRHFFAEHTVDERKAFAEQLIALTEEYATILVYDKTMEFATIEALIRSYPEYADELKSLKTKVRDVFDLFLNINYYDPAFKNNFSLKAVSAVLLHEASYTGISSGLEAMNYYNQYRLAQEPAEKETLKKELVDYCNTDCFATYGLMTFFKNFVNEQ